MLATERPGVYSDYEASGILWSSSGRQVGIAAQALGEQNRVYTVTRTSDAETIFGSGSKMVKLCALALQNGAAQVAAVPAGTGQAVDYAAAFAALEAQQVCAVLCDSTEDSVQRLLMESVLRASKAGNERIGFAVCGAEDPFAWAAGFNCERMVLVAQAPFGETDGGSLAAAMAAQVAKSTDPSASFNGVRLEGITGLNTTLREEMLDAYVKAGITPFEAVGGSVEIVRAVTSRTATGGVSDRVFQELNTVLVMDDVISGVRAALKEQMAGAKNNTRTRAAIATQAAVLLENKYAAGMIDGYLQPKVYPLEDNPAVCVAEIEFSVSRGLNQIHISAHIKV